MHRTLITSYFCRVNMAKFLRAAFFIEVSRSSRLKMFLGVLKSFANFTGKHLCWKALESFLKKLAWWRPATSLKKRLQQGCFPVKFAKFLRTPFLQNTSGGCFCIFLKEKLNSYFGTLLWRSNKFFLLDTSLNV